MRREVFRERCRSGREVSSDAEWTSGSESRRAKVSDSEEAVGGIEARQEGLI